jgi:hypothetical protein
MLKKGQMMKIHHLPYKTATHGLRADCLMCSLYGFRELAELLSFI